MDNLKYLAQGGRIKNSTAIIGNMLNVKPVMRANDEGKLENVQKVFSRKKALATLASDMKKKYDPQYDVCFIAHADCKADALFTKELIKKETSANVTIQDLGPVIGCHSGPGTLAIFYMADKR